MTQKYNGNDVFAPFNGGLYGIDDDPDRSLQFSESKASILDAFKADYEAKIRDTLASAGVRYVDLEYYSPRFYNFATDSIDIECEVIDTGMLVDALKARREAIQSALDANKSYDGYMATTPDTFDEVLADAERGELNIIALSQLLKGIDFADFDIYEHLEYEYPCEDCECIHSEYDNEDDDNQKIIKACIAKSAQTINHEN